MLLPELPHIRPQGYLFDLRGWVPIIIETNQSIGVSESVSVSVSDRGDTYFHLLRICVHGNQTFREEKNNLCVYACVCVCVRACVRVCVCVGKC